jgi:hypothetical protein
MIDTSDREKNRKRWRRLKMGWRAWRLYNKGSGWYHHAGGLGAIKANVAIAAAVAATTTAGTLGAIAIREKYIDHKPPAIETAAIAPAPASPPAEVRQTKNSVVFAIEGKDKAGRRGTFDVVVLNKSFLWVRGSAEELEKDGKAIPAADVAAAVLDEEVRAALSDAKEVITVGTASQEGNASEEVARAERRARQAATLIAQAVNPGTPISTLNLGQYREPCTNCETGGTSWQRPFIVVAVKSLEPNTNLGEALSDAMSGQDKLPAPKSYSAFDLGRFR